MIHGIRHVKVAVRIKRDAPGIKEVPRRSSRLSQNLNWFVVCIQDLDSTVPEFTYKLQACCVGPNIIRIAEFPCSTSRFSVSAEEFSIRRKNLDAMIARISHINSVLRIYAYSLSPVKLTGLISSFAKEAHEIRSVRPEVLHAFRCFIFADIHIAFRIHRHRSGE